MAAICRGNWSTLLRPFAPVRDMPALSFQSRVAGVTHADISPLPKSPVVSGIGPAGPGGVGEGGRVEGGGPLFRRMTVSRPICALLPSGRFPVANIDAMVSGPIDRPPSGQFGVGHGCGGACAVSIIWSCTDTVRCVADRSALTLGVARHFWSDAMGDRHGVISPRATSSIMLPVVKPKPFPLIPLAFTRACLASMVSKSVAVKSLAVGAGHGVVGPPKCARGSDDKSPGVFDRAPAGDGEPTKSVSDLVTVQRERRDIDRPAGETFARQISGYMVEPTVAKRARNLFSHDDRGPNGTDEAEKVGPQMPWVIDTAALARVAERLARTGPGPQGAVVGPAGETGGEGPTPNAGEEMGLGVSPQVIRLHVLD